MIVLPNFNDYRNGEFVKFTDLNAKIFSTQTNPELNIQNQIGTLAKVQVAMRNMYTIDRGSGLTAQIVGQDQIRDNSNSAILAILDAHAKYHPDELIQQQATDLLAVFTKHGRQLNRQSYHTQTINLDDIFQDLDNAKSQESIKACHIEDYYASLTNANESFDTLFLARNKEYAQAPKEKLASLRTDAEAALNALYARINAFITIDGIAKYEGLVNELNALIDNFTSAIKKRQANGSKNDSDDEEMDEDLNLINE